MAKRAELATLKNTSGFTDRLTMCVAFFARYIIGENPSVQNHQRRFSWAQGAILSPAGTASQIAALVALDDVFVNQPSPVSDWNVVLAGLPETGAGSLQAIAEAAIGSTVIAF